MLFFWLISFFLPIKKIVVIIIIITTVIEISVVIFFIIVLVLINFYGRSCQPLNFLEKSLSYSCESSLFTCFIFPLLLKSLNMFHWNILAGRRWRASKGRPWLGYWWTIWFSGNCGAKNHRRRCCFARIWVGGKFCSL